MESKAQSDVAEKLLSRGVDVILGSHPQVVQPIAHHVFDFTTSRVNDKYVAYSLGNFLSSDRLRYRDSGLVAYVHLEKRGLRTRVTGISYLPVYVQRAADGTAVSFRVLPVLPGSEPRTDTRITVADDQRMTQVWNELRDAVYRPDENIVPLDPADLGL